jgi:hypothetical protein
MRTSAATAVAASVLTVFAVAGCGAGDGASPPPAPSRTVDVAGLSADEALAASRSAADAAKSVHVVGDVSQGGQRTRLDLRLRDNGEGSGSITTTGGSVDVVRVGRDLYFKADEVTLTQILGPDRARTAGARFVKVPAGDSNFRSFRDLVDKHTLLEMLLFPAGTLSTVAGVPVDGVPTVGLHDDNKDAPGVLYVAASGSPFPLLIKPDDQSGGTFDLRLTDWNAAVEVTPPAPDQTVAIEDLEA